MPVWGGGVCGAALMDGGVMVTKLLTLPGGRRVELPTAEEDVAICAAIAADPDAHELDAAWFANAKRSAEVLPAGIHAELVAMNSRAGVCALPEDTGQALNNDSFRR
ncbi:MAG: hypothetical protein RLZZ494_2437 [Pseudomonadota bacterium]